MNILKPIFTSLCLGVFLAPTALAAEEQWSCPDGEFARMAIISGDIETWPHYTPGPGFRVQKQHPKTALTGQAKYVEGNNTTGALCQYYNHISVVLTIFIVGVAKSETGMKGYWRAEYIESTPETDDPDDLMMDVCTIDKGGLSYHSVECPFLIPDEE